MGGALGEAIVEGRRELELREGRPLTFLSLGAGERPWAHLPEDTGVWKAQCVRMPLICPQYIFLSDTEGVSLVENVNSCYYHFHLNYSVFLFFLKA
jgi:hypothetical protein